MATLLQLSAIAAVVAAAAWSVFLFVVEPILTRGIARLFTKRGHGYSYITMSPAAPAVLATAILIAPVVVVDLTARGPVQIDLAMVRQTGSTVSGVSIVS